MGLSDLKRVTDLFVEGTEVVLDKGGDGKDPVLLWVNKLNPFQAEECQRDGRAARSRVVLAIKENGSAEYVSFEAALSEMRNDALMEALLNQGNNKRFLDAVDDLRRDKDWSEKIEAAQRLSDDMTDEERDQVMAINIAYADELQKRIDARRDDEKLDMLPLDRASLEEKYRQGWLDNSGYAAFQREYIKTNMYYAVRVCSAVPTPVGGWDHSSCNGHSVRALDSREEATSLPAGLVKVLQDACREVEIPARDARFSDALSSSSESSVQPSEPEASVPSTPEVTQPELVTTS